MIVFRRKFARILGLLVLIAGLAGASLPAFAATPAPVAPNAMHAGMDCDGLGRHPSPKQHLPGGDCCLANFCVMILALPAAPSGLPLPRLAETPGYAIQIPHQPLGIVAAPIPHPPKARA